MNHKKIIFLIIVAGIIARLSLFGYFAFKEGDIKNSYKTDQKTQTTSSSITPVQPEISIFDVSAQVIEDLKNESRKLSNRPWKIGKSAAKIAEIKSISKEEVLRITAENAARFFGLE